MASYFLQNYTGHGKLTDYWGNGFWERAKRGNLVRDILAHFPYAKQFELAFGDEGLIVQFEAGDTRLEWVQQYLMDQYSLHLVPQ